MRTRRKTRANVVSSLAAVVLAGLAPTATADDAPATPTVEMLGWNSRTTYWAGQWRADFTIRVPKGQLPTKVEYNPYPNKPATWATLKQLGDVQSSYGEVYGILETQVDGDEEILYVSARGNAELPSVAESVTHPEQGIRVTLPGGSVSTHRYSVENIGRKANSGRPVAVQAWKLTTAGLPGYVGPNALTGWGNVVHANSQAQLTGATFHVDAQNSSRSAAIGCDMTDELYYQFVRGDDGTPAAITPTPVRKAIANHTTEVKGALLYELGQFTLDDPGYYQLLVWPRARSSSATAPQDCSAVSYDPAVLSEGTPVGGVFWKIPAEVRTLDRLEVVGGDDQVVDLGATFAPLSVRATDDAGRPLVCASVTFAVTDAGGTGTAFQDGGTVTVTTGADGVATTDRALVAGGVPGGVGITATSGDLTTAFVGTVGTPEPERVEKVGGDGMSAEAGAYFGEPLVARVVSASGAGVGDIPVTYTVQGGTGSRFAASADPGVRVADDGASVTVTSLPGTGAAVTPRLIAGPQPGAFAVRAVADGVPSAVTFDLEVVAGEATGLTIHKGDGQSTAPYEPFASNLQVKVTNSAGEAVQGVGVTFEIQGPTGSLFADNTNSATAITDSSGLAGTTRIIAGDSGTVTVVARIPGGTTVTFSLTVTGSTHLGLNPVTGEAR